MKLKILEVIMSRYKDSNKYKIYGEDAILAARFDKYLDATLRNCRADYLKALSKRKQRKIIFYFGCKICLFPTFFVFLQGNSVSLM